MANRLNIGHSNVYHKVTPYFTVNLHLNLGVLAYESAVYLTVTMGMLECSSCRWDFDPHSGMRWWLGAIGCYEVRLLCYRAFAHDMPTGSKETHFLCDVLF